MLYRIAILRYRNAIFLELYRMRYRMRYRIQCDIACDKKIIASVKNPDAGPGRGATKTLPGCWDIWKVGMCYMTCYHQQTAHCVWMRIDAYEKRYLRIMRIDILGNCVLWIAYMKCVYMRMYAYWFAYCNCVSLRIDCVSIAYWLRIMRIECVNHLRISCVSVRIYHLRKYAYWCV